MWIEYARTEWQARDGEKIQVYTPIYITGNDGVQRNEELTVCYGEGYRRDYEYGTMPRGTRPTDQDVEEAFQEFCTSRRLNREHVVRANGSIEEKEQDMTASVRKAQAELLDWNKKSRNTIEN